jgi:hypothetical protein
VNSGVSSTIVKVNIEIMLGIRIKKVRVYFQKSIRYDSSEISDIPKENPS